MENIYKVLIQELSLILGEMDNYRYSILKKNLSIHSNHQVGAKNLCDYLAFRAKDRTNIQAQLTSCGLSSLGRSESKIREQIDRVKTVLLALSDDKYKLKDYQVNPDIDIDDKVARLFGEMSENRNTRIMVTMPNHVVDSPELIKDWLESGMNVARINCGHDTPDIWIEIVRIIKKYCQTLKKDCKIFMDLAGPKIRINGIPNGPKVLRAKTTKDVYGKIIKPAKIRFVPTSQYAKGSKEYTTIPISVESFRHNLDNKHFTLKDARDKKRKINVISIQDNEILGESYGTIFFETHNQLKSENGDILTVAEIEPVEGFIAIHPGDNISLVGRTCGDKQIGCTTPEIFKCLNVGERVKFDDGKATAIIDSVTQDKVDLQILKTPINGLKLKNDKGINFSRQ